MKRVAFILSVLFSFSSCQKFLDKEPSNEIPDDMALERFSDIDAALNGCYKRMLSVGYYGKNFILYSEVASDNMKLNVARSTGSFQSVYFFTLNKNSSEPKDLWNATYEVINNANRIIKALPSIADGSTEEKNNALGEAMAIRALVHFDLLRVFAQPYLSTPDASHAGVPIITENSSSTEPSRNTVAEGYTQIINDLTQATTLLSSERNKVFAFNNLSVRALLARVYLYKQDWENAKNYAVAIISENENIVSKALFPIMWSMESQSDEDIMMLGFTNFDYLTTRSIGYQLLENGYGDIISTSDLYNLYETGDIRKTLISQAGKDYYCNKYPGRNEVIGLDNIHLIRKSEMYLTASEAMAELGKEDSAKFYIGKLRSSRFEEEQTINAVGDSLKTLIQLERRRELAFEGHRLFDLTRRKQDVVRKDVISGAPNYKAYNDNRIIMPIPQRELDANKNMTQNPGY